MTQFHELFALNAKSYDELNAPYTFIIDNQDYNCNMTREQSEELMKLCNKIPTISMTDMSRSGLRVRYVSRRDELFLYVEIDQVGSDKFYVTSFVDKDFEYLAGYYSNI